LAGPYPEKIQFIEAVKLRGRFLEKSNCIDCPFVDDVKSRTDQYYFN